MQQYRVRDKPDGEVRESSEGGGGGGERGDSKSPARRVGGGLYYYSSRWPRRGSGQSNIGPFTYRSRLVFYLGKLLRI